MGTTKQDGEEISQLYRQYGAALVLFAAAICGDRARAQDAVHQVFLKLMESDAVQKASNQKAFLFSCVRNAVLNDRKRRQRDSSLEIDGPWFCPPERDYAAEARLRIELSKLPNEQREVIVLHLWSDLTFAEIGQVLGLNANTAASRYRYALTKLRSLFFQKEQSCAQLK